MSVVIGIDASLTRTAFAVLPQRRHEVVETKPDTPLHRRLRAIAEAAYRFTEQVGREAAAIPHLRASIPSESCPYCDSPPGFACLASGTTVRVIVEEPGWTGNRDDSGKAAVVIAEARGAVLAGLPPTAQFRVEKVAVNKARADLGLHAARGQHKLAAAAYVHEHGIELPMNGRKTDFDVSDAFLLCFWGQRYESDVIAAARQRYSEADFERWIDGAERFNGVSLR